MNDVTTEGEEREKKMLRDKNGFLLVNLGCENGLCGLMFKVIFRIMIKVKLRLCVDHLMRPPVHAGWSLRCVCLKMQRESERKRSEEVAKAGEAGGAPPSPAAGDTHAPTVGVSSA